MQRICLLIRFDNAATLAAVAFIGLLAGTGNSAEPTKSTPLRLAYSAITVNQAIPWISYESGHFKKYGLDVELVHASSILALQALLAGEVAIAQSVTDACVSANLNGADTVFLGAILDKPLYGFMVNPKIKTPQDLKGKRIGVTRFGATPDALARAMLKMWGLDPTTDVTLVQLNEMSLLVQGLANGVIDAAPISIPGNIRAKNLGFVELFDMTKINKTYITGTVVTRKRFIDGQKDIAHRFMKGFLEGMKPILRMRNSASKLFRSGLAARTEKKSKKPMRCRRATCSACRVHRLKA